MTRGCKTPIGFIFFDIGFEDNLTYTHLYPTDWQGVVVYMVRQADTWADQILSI